MNPAPWSVPDTLSWAHTACGPTPIAAVKVITVKIRRANGIFIMFLLWLIVWMCYRDRLCKKYDGNMGFFD
jgi:hypothetical protein